jgi:hypothetical protein
MSVAPSYYFDAGFAGATQVVRIAHLNRYAEDSLQMSASR